MDEVKGTEEVATEEVVETPQPEVATEE